MRKYFKESNNYDHPGWLFMVSVLLALGIIVLRDLYSYTAPAALLEDGKYLLEYYRDERSLGSIFRFYAGYISFIPNLIGYLASVLPLRLTLHVLQISATLITAFTCALPAARFFLPGLLRRSERIMLVLLLAGLPSANFAVHQLTIYSIWHMLLAACLLVSAVHIRTYGQALLAFCIVATSIVSHPATVLLLPLFLLRGMVGAGLDRLVFLGLFVLGSVYALFGIDTSSESRAVLDPNSVAKFLLDFTAAFSERVISETLISTKLRMIVKWHGFDWLFHVAGFLSVLLLGAASIFMIRRREPLLWPFFSLIFFAVALLAFTTHTRGPFLDTPYSHRYSYLSAVAVVIALVFVVYALLNIWPALRWPVYFGLGLWLIALNFLSLDYYRVDPRQGALMQRALQVYEDRIKEDGAACVTLKRKTFWDVTLASGPGLECIVITSPE